VRLHGILEPEIDEDSSLPARDLADLLRTATGSLLSSQIRRAVGGVS
jgi:hypothetical protein